MRVLVFYFANIKGFPCRDEGPSKVTTRFYTVPTLFYMSFLNRGHWGSEIKGMDEVRWQENT